MLLDTATGTQITLTGWDVQYAQMPSFSPDGTMIAFNWYDKSMGHTLAVANFDTATNTISNVRELYTRPTLFVGWPWITPDNQEVIFVLGNAPDYVSGYPGPPRHRLERSVDRRHRERQDATARAAPTVTPRTVQATYLPQAGPRRALRLLPDDQPHPGGRLLLGVLHEPPHLRQLRSPQVVDDAVTKKIWVSAINIRTGADIIEDPSNPPFYLPGQEDAAGNVRAFAALEPCHKDGDVCETASIAAMATATWESAACRPLRLLRPRLRPDSLRLRLRPRAVRTSTSAAALPRIVAIRRRRA